MHLLIFRPRALFYRTNCTCRSIFLMQGCTKWRAGGAAAPPDFGTSEGAARQRRRAALLPAPPDFWPLVHPCNACLGLCWVHAVNQKARKNSESGSVVKSHKFRRKSFSQPLGHVTILIPCRDSRNQPSNSKISLNALISTFLVLIYILGQFCCFVTYGLWCFNIT